MSTKITVLDHPCGFGKSTILIKELKSLTVTNPDMQFLIVLPELGEVNRFITALGSNWHTPSSIKGSSKTNSLIELMGDDKNVITTHALYEKIKKFEHLLPKYHVVIDEVPTVADKVVVKFGKGIFNNLITKQKYISIDPVTKKITATQNWYVDAAQYEIGDDKHIKEFMQKVIWADVFYVQGLFCVMPLPDAFFTKPKSLKIATFLFRGTQLDHYIKLRGYKYTLKQDKKALAKFKQEMRVKLFVYPKTVEGKAGYAVMTDKKPQRRRQVGHFVKKTIKTLRKIGQPIEPNNVLVASYKDAWYGREKNATSKVLNTNRLKSLTSLGKASYTALVTRGTNKFKDRQIIFILGKLNINPHLAKFLNMNTKKARDKFVLSELIQLIYRTGIRDGKNILLVSADKENLRLLKEFLLP